MPIFEYYCRDCNAIFQFWCQTLSSAKTPACPKCGTLELKKQISAFAVTGAERKSTGSKAREPSAGGAFADSAAAGAGTDSAGLDDPRLEQAMTQLMTEAEGMDENDPRQLGRLMRRMGAITGEPVDKHLDAAIRRLEAGEEPEAIEADMGDILGGDDDSAATSASAPLRDNQLYEM